MMNVFFALASIAILPLVLDGVLECLLQNQ